MKLLSLTFAAALLLSGTALASPTLKGDITVNKAIVTIGDMFDDAGSLAETAIFPPPRRRAHQASCRWPI